MFTGIVEEIGRIKEFSRLSSGAKIAVECENILTDAKLGDSIAINGCCQTVTEIGGNYFKADVSEETLRITNFGTLKPGVKVNLERALTPASRMGGHIVQGHIDCTGKFLRFEKLSDFYNLTFEVPAEFSRYIVYKGSIAVNGVSLTIASVRENIFTVAVIPHTYQNTTMQDLKSGDIVNIETDILGRYVEKFLLVDNNSRTINEEFLRENGFV